MSTLQITGSSVSGPLNAVTMGGDGTVEGEEARGEDSFGAPGIVFRPRPPSDVEGSDGQTYRVGAEAMGARMGDRLTPFTWRDLRLNKVFPAPKEGTIALVGYGGAFLAFDDATDGSGNSVATLYVPYAKSGGVATKCHVICLDPAQNALGIVHGDGAAISLSEDGITMRSPGGTSSFQLTDTDCAIGAQNISLMGVVSIAKDPASLALAVPLLAGVASPPCTSLLLAP